MLFGLGQVVHHQVGGDDRLERLDILRVEERMQHRDGALELLLDAGTARDREMHGAVLAPVTLPRLRRRNGKRRDEDE